MLAGISHDWQKLNNCGPTTVAMALSFYGFQTSQFEIAPLLKGGPQDKNVGPDELAGYLQAQGFVAPVLVNGDLDMVRQFLANDVPVIVEQWLARRDEPLTGHYRLVRGYDRAAATFLVNDSYLGPGLAISEADFDKWWRPFGRLFIPIVPPPRRPLLRAIVGPALDDPALMWADAERRAAAELALRSDAEGWFTLGTARLRQGRPAEAVAAYEQALAIGLPSERMLWYQFGPFEAYNATGQFTQTLVLSAPFAGVGIEEIEWLRGAAFEGLGQPAEAVAAYRAALAARPTMAEALDALARLAP